jgi:hypothetical protein
VEIAAGKNFSIKLVRFIAGALNCNNSRVIFKKEVTDEKNYLTHY